MTVEIQIRSVNVKRTSEHEKMGRPVYEGTVSVAVVGKPAGELIMEFPFGPTLALDAAVQDALRGLHSWAGSAHKEAERHLARMRT